MNRLARALFACLLSAGCTNYDALVERCIAEGRCPEGAGGGGSGGTPHLAADKPQLPFSTALTDSSPPVRVVLTNDGNGETGSISVAAEGAGAADYDVSAAACSGGLSPTQTCAVDVVFHPRGSTLGARDAQLVARPGRGDLLSIPLQGTATAAFDAPASFDLGAVTVPNDGKKTLTVTTLTSMPRTLVGTTAPPFFVEVNRCNPVGSQAACTIDLRYEARDGGSSSGTLQLDVSGSTTRIDVPLTGFGVVPGVLRITPAPLFDGGLQPVGTNDDRPFTVTNTGSQQVTVALSVNPLAGDAFSLAANGCGVLDAGTSCTGTLRFSPPAVATYRSQLLANAGPAGADLLEVEGSGQRDVTFRLTVAPPDSGAATFQLGAGAAMPCTAQCQTTRTITPFNATPVTVRAQRTVWWDLMGFSGACSTDAGSCVVVLDGGSAAVDVGVDFTPVNRVFLAGGSANPGITPIQLGAGRQAVDRQCANLASDAGLPGTYVAWLSVADGGAIARLPAQGGWQRLDGRPFAMSRAALARGEVLSRISLTQRGVELANAAAIVVTGTQADGTPAANTCNDWSGGGPTEAAIGTTDGTTRDWTSTHNCCGYYCTNTQLAFYCFQIDGRGAPLQPQFDGGQMVFIATGGTAFDAGFNSDAGVSAYRWFDDVCTQRAAAFGLQGSARALLAAQGSSVSARVPLPFSVSRPDGVRFGSSSLVGSMERDPVTPNVRILPDGGIDYVTSAVATGSMSAQGSSGANCQDWTNPSADLSFGPQVGVPNHSGRVWYYGGGGANPSGGCNVLLGPQMSVYCVSDPQ